MSPPGDVITPAPIEYDYPLLFDEGSIRLLSYPLETILAEKLETVVSRGVTNTRPRDYYDIHILWNLKRENCDISVLAKALEATSVKRESANIMTLWESALTEVEADSAMLQLWQKYAKKNPYVAPITLPQCCQTAKEIMNKIA